MVKIRLRFLLIFPLPPPSRVLVIKEWRTMLDLTQSQHGMRRGVCTETILWIYAFKCNQNYPSTAALLLPRLSQPLGVIGSYLRTYFKE